MNRLPADVRSIVERLQQLAPKTRGALEATLDAYEQALTAGGAHHPLADGELAWRIAHRCRALLADAANRAADRLRMVQLAIDYLVLDNDAESDSASLSAFDDDAQVFDWVARALGRPDLVVAELGG